MTGCAEQKLPSLGYAARARPTSPPPPNGVFLFGWEYDRPALAGVQRSDFPPRPDHFELKGPTGFECLGPSYVVVFREAGRLFQIHVVLGPQAGEDARATALNVLDSLEVSSQG